MSEAEIYKRAYFREKEARKESERILEEKSYELFAMNSELLSANEQLKSQQKKLVKAEKLAAIGELAAGVAHEVNNPLAFVISNLSVLKQYFDEYKELFTVLESSKIDQVMALFERVDDLEFMLEDSVKIFDDASEGLARVSEIVSNLRSYARTKQGDVSDVCVDECIQSALKMLETKTKYHCTIDYTPQNLPNVRMNKNELIQVFLNIIRNATQAVTSNGRIDIRCRLLDEYINVDIHDDGIGIAEDNLDRIFNPFFTSKEIGEGTGLGLSVSFNIMENVGGTISVQSVLGEGSTFSILLPLNPESC